MLRRIVGLPGEPAVLAIDRRAGWCIVATYDASAATARALLFRTRDGALLGGVSLGAVRPIAVDAGGGRAVVVSTPVSSGKGVSPESQAAVVIAAP